MKIVVGILVALIAFLMFCCFSAIIMKAASETYDLPEDMENDYLWKDL